MIPCISQLCTLPHPFEEDLRAAAAAGCTHLETWLTKLEQHLNVQGAEATRQLMERYNVRLAAAALQGGLLQTDAQARATAEQLFRQRLEICEALSVPVMVVAADFPTAPDPHSLAASLNLLTRAALWAEAFNVKIALEFRGKAPFCNNLETAIALVEQCGQANLGICLDLFHFMQGPSKEDDLRRLSPANLFHVQLCDIPGLPRESMTDADRILPGEGDFNLQPLLTRLREIAYPGAVSLEIQNPIFWKSKPSQVLELGWSSLQRVLTT